MAPASSPFGLHQIGEATHELDQSTQSNAALVEETAAACSDLRERSAALARTVSSFQLPAMESSAAPGLDHSATTFDFDNAVEAHRAWKVKLRHAIAAKEHLDAATICKDDQCALGKWLHGDGQSLQSSSVVHRPAGGTPSSIRQQVRWRGPSIGRPTARPRSARDNSRFSNASTQTVAAILSLQCYM